MVVGFALLLAVVLGGVFGLLIIKDAGYVLISYGDTIIETSVWVALLLLVVLYFFVRLVIWAFTSLGRGQGWLMSWRSNRRSQGARRQTVRGLLLMAEGRWGEARKAFLHSVDNAETPLINYLSAARAAHEMGDREGRDEHLKRAHETTPGAKFAALLTQAEFQMEDGQHEQALASLLNLRKTAPKHGAVLKMLVQCFEALGDYASVHEHLKELNDRKAVPEEEIARLSRLVWRDMLATGDDVEGRWKKMPRSVKEDRDLIRNWITTLVDQGNNSAAERAIRLILDESWDDELVRIYGRLDADPPRQLIVARGWSKSRPSDAAVALATGRLCLRNEEFAQARDFLESALRLKPDAETYGELGRLCIALGDERRGADYLLKSVATLPDLPLPAQPSLRSKEPTAS